MDSLICLSPPLLLLTEWILVFILFDVIRLDHEDLVDVFTIGQGRLLPHLLFDLFFFIMRVVVAGFLIKTGSHNERLLLIVLVLGSIVIICKVREELLINVLHLIHRLH